MDRMNLSGLQVRHDAVEDYHRVVKLKPLSVAGCRLWQRMRPWVKRGRSCRAAAPVVECIRWPQERPPTCQRSACCSPTGRWIGATWILFPSSCCTSCFSSPSSWWWTRLLRWRGLMGLRCKPCWKFRGFFSVREVLTPKSCWQLMAFWLSSLYL